ncbi:MAG: hypothetical protein U0V48_09360 [Anaerolineales bacterium]
MCYTPPVAVIRSSDIGNYLYCRRAWWYKKQGVESENQAEMATGRKNSTASTDAKSAISTLARTVGLILPNARANSARRLLHSRII